MCLTGRLRALLRYSDQSDHTAKCAGALTGHRDTVVKFRDNGLLTHF